MSDLERDANVVEDRVAGEPQFANKSQFIMSHFEKVIASDGKRGCLVDTCSKRLKHGKSSAFQTHLQSAVHQSNKTLQSEIKKWINSTVVKNASIQSKKLPPAVVLPSKRRRSSNCDMHQRSVEVQDVRRAAASEFITSHFEAVDPPLLEELSEATALCFAMLDWPLSWTESIYLRQMLLSFAKAFNRNLVTQLDGKVKIAQQQQLLVDKLDIDVIARLKSSTHPIVLCHDGWKNVSGRHVINLLAHSSCGTFLLASHDCENGRQTAEVIFDFLKFQLDSLIDKGVVVAAVVADNASVNGSVAKLLQESYPWMLPLPCASHTLQLCILRVFDEDIVSENLRSTCKKVFSAIANSGPLLALFLRFQSGIPKRLHKPQRTRWSSFYLCFKSVASCENAVKCTLASELASPAARELGRQLNDQFWQQLNAMVSFLEPFSIASDIIQGSHASLLDVHLQFESLTRHVKNPPAGLSHAASIMRRAMSHHWSAHVDQQAVYMAAKFACEEDLEQSTMFSSQAKLKAPKWFFKWAAQICHHNHKQKSPQAVSLDHEDLTFEIEEQYDLFVAGSYPYVDVRADVIASRPKQKFPGQLFAPFNVLSLWRRLADLPMCRNFVYSVIALLSLNCSEASVERSFSQQKLTHSLLTNRKAPATVSRQVRIKWNNRELAKRDQTIMKSMRSVVTIPEQQVQNAPLIEDDEQDDDENENFELQYSSDELSSDGEDEAAASAREARQRALNRGRGRGRARSSVVVPVEQRSKHGWTKVARLTVDLDEFCTKYIADHDLCWPRPFRGGGANKLRNVLEANPTMRQEQFSDVQAHIIHLLMQQHREQQRDSAAAAADAVDGHVDGSE